MRSEQIGEYEIECAGIPLATGEGWAAHLSIFAPSRNPMHRNNVFPDQRVSIDTIFPTEADAEEEAYKIGVQMIQQGNHQHTPGS
jgi:hypothetical protein